MLEYAILVYARFMRECIRADNGLVGLNRKTGNARYQLTGRYDMSCIYARVTREKVLAGSYRHHDLFQCCIARTFAESVDGALHLTSPVHYRGQ